MVFKSLGKQTGLFYYRKLPVQASGRLRGWAPVTVSGAITTASKRYLVSAGRARTPAEECTTAESMRRQAIIAQGQMTGRQSYGKKLIQGVLKNTQLDSHPVTLTASTSPAQLSSPYCPSRLPAYALLSAYLRFGDTHQSQKVLRRMLEKGLRVRPSTIDNLFRACMAKVPSEAKPLQVSRTMSKSGPLVTLHPHMVTNEDLREALQILLMLRVHHLPRTLEMYTSIVDGLLSQEEHIVAALVFELMVKDYYLLQVLPSILATSDSNITNRQELEARYRHLRAENLYPEEQILDNILNSISRHLWISSHTRIKPSTLQSILQAIGTLAGLIEHKQLPFSNPSKLIDTLFMTKDRGLEIWVSAHPEAVKVNGHKYFEAVLQSLASTLPSKPPATTISDPKNPLTLMPPLEFPTYSRLIENFILIKKDYVSAGKVLKHMMGERQQALVPDATICHLVLGRRSKLRDMGLGTEIVETLRDLAGEYEVAQRMHEDNRTNGSATAELEPASLIMID